MHGREKSSNGAVAFYFIVNICKVLRLHWIFKLKFQKDKICIPISQYSRHEVKIDLIFYLVNICRFNHGLDINFIAHIFHELFNLNFLLISIVMDAFVFFIALISFVAKKELKNNYGNNFSISLRIMQVNTNQQ